MLSSKRFFHISSRSQMFFKIGVLKNFAILRGKHLFWNRFPVIIAQFLTSASPSPPLTLCLCLCLSVSFSVCLCLCLALSRSVCLSVSPLSLSLSIYLSISLFLSLSEVSKGTNLASKKLRSNFCTPEQLD